MTTIYSELSKNIFKSIKGTHCKRWSQTFNKLYSAELNGAV